MNALLFTLPGEEKTKSCSVRLFGKLSAFFDRAQAKTARLNIEIQYSDASERGDDV